MDGSIKKTPTGSGLIKRISRDGMPVATTMRDGTYVLPFFIFKFSNFFGIHINWNIFALFIVFKFINLQFNFEKLFCFLYQL